MPNGIPRGTYDIDWYREPGTRRWKWIGRDPAGEIIGGYGTPPPLYYKPGTELFYTEKPPALEPITFTARQAKAEGFDMPEGWQLKLTPFEGEFKQTLINPAGEELTFEEAFAKPEGRWLAAQTDEQARVAELLSDLGLGFARELVIDLRTLEEYVSTQPDAFLQDITAMGRTPQVETSLRALGATDEDLRELLGDIGLGFAREVPVAITAEGDRVEMPWWESAWNSLYLGIRTGLHQLKQSLFTVVLPNLFPYVKAGESVKVSLIPGIPGMPSIPTGRRYGEQEAAFINQALEPWRAKFREVAISQEAKFDDWIKKHPELQPKPEYRQDPFENPELLTDSGWWINTMAETTGVMLPSLLAGIAVTFTTKRPMLGALTTAAAMTPLEMQGLYDDLILHGCPRERAEELALVIGAAIGAVEVGPSLILMKAIYPVFKPFRRGLQTAIIRAVMRHMIAKGVTNFTAIEVSEALEEVLQGAIADYTVSYWDENRDIISKIPGTILQTLVGVLPIAIFGGGMSMRRVRPQDAIEVPDDQKKAEGWEFDEITEQWYKPEKMIDTFNEYVEEFKVEGLEELQARFKALNEMARTKEGEKAISEAAKKIKEGEEIKPITLPEEGVYQKGDVFTTVEGDVKVGTWLASEKMWQVTLPDGKVLKMSFKSMDRLVEAGTWTKKPVVVTPVVPEAVPEVKPLEVKWETTKRVGGVPTEKVAIEGEVTTLFHRIMKGEKKGWWRSTIKGTEYVAKTPEGVLEIIKERQARELPKPPAVEKPVVPVEAPERAIYSEGGVPVNPDEVLPQQIVANIPIIKDIGAKERVRPTRKVFEKMGLYEEYKGIQEAEVLQGEARQAFAKKLKEVNKWVDKKRRHIVFRELENPGTVEGLTFNEKRAVNWFLRFFGEWADTLNLPQEKRVSYYVTHIFEADIEAQLKAKHPLDIAMVRALEYKTPKTIFNPFLQERLGATVGLVEDPFAAASAYESRQLRVLYYEPLLQKISVIANAETTPQAARNYLQDYSQRMTGKPSKLDQEINNTLKELGEKIAKLPGGTPFARFLTRGNPSGMASYQFTSALYTLWLGFKPTSAIRNLSQHTLIIGETGPVRFAEAIAKTATEESKQAIADSLGKRSRRAAFVPGVDDSFQSRWLDKFREAALWMFRGADSLNTRHAFLAGYYEAKHLLPEADRQVWIDRGDEVLADTQYLYTKMNSMALSQTSLGRVFSVLTTWSINWMELMTKWVSRRPSQVYLQYEKATGKKVAGANWSTSYKAILMYMAIVALGYLIKEESRLKAWEYTGITSIRYLADVIGGDFPGLQVPGAVASMIAGFIADDERMFKQGWYDFRSSLTPGIIRQLENVASGDRDWLTLFFYLEGKDWQIKKLKNQWEKGWKEYEALAPKDRDEYRKANPLIEAQMFVTGKFTTLSSDEARAEVLRLIEKHKLDPELIDGYEKVFGVDTDKEFSKWKKMLGTVELTEEGEQKLKENGELDYFTTSNFASEVNKLLKVVGRYKIEKDGNALAIEYLRAKDLWTAYEDLTDEGARILYRQQFPDIEAYLYLFGKLSTFKNPKSAEILLGLMDKYGIPPEAIPAFLDNPEKYDELFTQKFELEKKWFDLSTEYENYGNSESPLYIEDKEARLEAREKLKLDNPEWIADLARIEAIDHGGGEWVEPVKKSAVLDFLKRTDIDTKQYIEGKYVCDDFTKDMVKEAAKAKLPIGYALVQFNDLYFNTKRVEGLTQDIIDKFFAEYPDVEQRVSSTRLFVQRIEYWDEFQKFLGDNPDIAKKITFGNDPQISFQYQKHALGWIDLGGVRYYLEPQNDQMMTYAELEKYWSKYGGIHSMAHEEPEYLPEGKGTNIVELWAEREKLLIDFSPNSAEAKVWLLDNPEVHQWALDNKLLTDDGSDWDERLLRLNVELRGLDEDSEEYQRLNYKKSAYEIDFPEDQIETYVEWYTNTKLQRPEDYKGDWYEDDWWLQEHPDFHAALVASGVWDKPRDFSKLPSREVWDLYLVYRLLENYRLRLDFRIKYRELDAWGQIRFDWKPATGEISDVERLSKWEKLARDIAETEKRARELGK